MTRYVLVLVFLRPAGAPAFGQQPSDGLTDQQRLGRQLLSQNCGVYHLPPPATPRRTGPCCTRERAAATTRSCGGGDCAALGYDTFELTVSR